MKINKKMLPLLWISIFGFILISISVLYFILKFKHQYISEDIKDWSAFGDYFGGILNPIISLLSLIVLGYITYLISRNDNEENKNLYLLQKRIDAYDELLKYLPKINNVVDILSQNLVISLAARIKINKKKSLTKSNFNKNDDSIDIQSDQNKYADAIEEIRVELKFFIELYNYLMTFQIRYEYLFKFNFESKLFKELVENAKLVKEGYHRLYIGLYNSGEFTLNDDFKNSNNRMKELLLDFIVYLEMELK
jgi:hypothetical protein